MILDIPTSADFEEQGMTLLNLAWDSVTQLLFDHQALAKWAGDPVDGEAELYIKASQKPLGIATVLLQQGSEFLVKAAIAKISPLLLIAGNSQSWPKRCDSTDIAFSMFKTPDAEDLIRIHNTVAPKRFSEAFTQQFGKLRRIRNTVFHTIDRNLRFTEKDILSAILTVTTELQGPANWMENRVKYLESTPVAAFDVDRAGYTLAMEFEQVIELLGDADLKSHFDFSKRRRRYLCLECKDAASDFDDGSFQPKTAQLKPNSPSSREVYCVVCRTTFPVARTRCNRTECNGNVIHQSTQDKQPGCGYYDPVCLTCGELGKE